MSEVYGFVYGVTRRYYADIDLFFPRQAQTGDDARPEVDQGTVRARNGGVGIEHLSLSQPEPVS